MNCLFLKFNWTKHNYELAEGLKLPHQLFLRFSQFSDCLSLHLLCCSYRTVCGRNYNDHHNCKNLHDYCGNLNYHHFCKHYEAWNIQLRNGFLDHTYCMSCPVQNTLCHQSCAGKNHRQCTFDFGFCCNCCDSLNDLCYDHLYLYDHLDDFHLSRRGLLCNGLASCEEQVHLRRQ